MRSSFLHMLGFGDASTGDAAARNLLIGAPHERDAARILADSRAARREELRASRAAEARAAAERIAAEEIAAAEKADAERRKAAEARAAAERKAAEEKAAAERAESERRKAAEERAVAERKAAEERAAVEKAEAERKRVAEEKAAAEKRAAEEKEAAEKARRERQRLEAEREAADKVEAERRKIAEEKAAAEKKEAEARAEKERAEAERKAAEETRKAEEAKKAEEAGDAKKAEQAASAPAGTVTSATAAETRGRDADRPGEADDFPWVTSLDLPDLKFAENEEAKPRTEAAAAAGEAAPPAKSLFEIEAEKRREDEAARAKEETLEDAPVERVKSVFEIEAEKRKAKAAARAAREEARKSGRTAREEAEKGDAGDAEKKPVKSPFLVSPEGMFGESGIGGAAGDGLAPEKESDIQPDDPAAGGIGFGSASKEAPDLDIEGPRLPRVDLDALFGPVPGEREARPGAGTGEAEHRVDALDAAAAAKDEERPVEDELAEQDFVEAEPGDAENEAGGGFVVAPEPPKVSVAYATEEGRMVAPCPNCAHLLNVNTSMIGVSGKCPNCKTAIVAGEKREATGSQLIVSIDAAPAPTPAAEAIPAPSSPRKKSELKEIGAVPDIADTMPAGTRLFGGERAGAIADAPGPGLPAELMEDSDRAAEEGGRKLYSPPPAAERLFPYGSSIMDEPEPKPGRRSRTAWAALVLLSCAVIAFVAWRALNSGADDEGAETPGFFLNEIAGPGAGDGVEPGGTGSGSEMKTGAPEREAGLEGFEVKPGVERVPAKDAIQEVAIRGDLPGFKLTPDPTAPPAGEGGSFKAGGSPSAGGEETDKPGEPVSAPAGDEPMPKDGPGIDPGTPPLVAGPSVAKKEEDKRAGGTPEPAAEGNAPNVADAKVVAPLGDLSALDERDRMSTIAKHTLESFMKATTAEAKSKFVLHAERSLPEMEEYYKAHEQKDFDGIISLEGILQDEESKLWVSAFNIWEPGNTAYVLVYVVGDEARGHKVDWDWYYQVRGEGLKEYFAEPREAPKLIRAVLRRTHFYGDLANDEPEPLSIRIETPFTQTFTGTIYLEPFSPIAQQLRRQLKWSQERMATMELEWVEDNRYGTGKRVNVKEFHGWGLALDRAF